MVIQEITSIQQLVQQQPEILPYQYESNEESTHVATTSESDGPHQEGEGKSKRKKKGNTVANPPPCPCPGHHTPPRRKRTTSRRARSRTSRGQEGKRKIKIPHTANIAQSTGGAASHTAHQTTSRTPSATTTRSGRGGGWSGFARKSG